MTSYEYLKNIVGLNSNIKELILREYTYPANPPGTSPAYEDRIKKITRIEFLDSTFIQKILDKLPKNRNIGVESRVVVKKQIMHIPMVNFSVSKSESNLEELLKKWNEVLPRKFQNGGIIETDNSYHFIGSKKLLTQDEYLDFLSWCLLLVENEKENNFKEFVDVQYVAYCILKRSACVRISKYPKARLYPTLLKEI